MKGIKVITIALGLVLSVCGNMITAAYSQTIVFNEDHPLVNWEKKIILNGKFDANIVIDGCEVIVEAGDNLTINGNLEIKNFGLITFLGDGDLVVMGDATIKTSGVFRNNDGKGRVVVNGSVQAGREDSSWYDSPGRIEGELHVKQNAMLPNGSLTLWGENVVEGNATYRELNVTLDGSLNVEGDLLFSTFENDDAPRELGISKADNATVAKVLIKGNAVLEGGNCSIDSIEIKGDVAFNNGKTSSRHFPKIVLSGDSKQTLSVNNELTVYIDSIQVMQPSNSGVYLSEGMLSSRSIQSNGTPFYDAKFYECWIEDDFYEVGDATIKVPKLNGHTLTINGNLFLEKEAKLFEGDSLIVTKNLTVKKKLELTGSIDVSGDCIGLNDAYIEVNAPGVLRISKNLIAEFEGYGYPDIRGNGIVELKGDIRKFSSGLHGTGVNFKLVGEEQQNLLFRHFVDISTLKNENTSAGGITLSTTYDYGEDGRILKYVHNCNALRINADKYVFQDTDSDGQKDNVDAYPEDPTRWEPEGICLAVTRDFDKDGMDDGDELKYFGDASQTPTDDYDQDKLTNAWELEHGFDPINSSDAALDADGDSFTNLQEFLAGTDPNDPASVPTSSSVFNPAAINLLLLD